MKIKSTKDASAKRIHGVIYAPSKYGKTTLAGTLEGKTLIVSAESGLLSLHNKEIDYVEVNSLKEIREVISEISKGTDYENIFFDSLTEIGDYYVEEAKQMFPDPAKALPMWGHYNKEFKKFIKFTRDMSDYNVFYTCLMKTDKDNIGRQTHLPDIAGSMASKLPQFFDEIMSIVLFEKDDKEKRLLLTTPTNGFICGDRSGLLDKYEPMNLQNIVNKIKGVKND